MSSDLFAYVPIPHPGHGETETPVEGATILRGFVLAAAPQLIAAVETIVTRAPLRRMITPGGHTMSVSMSNCGRLGWISDRAGYRYTSQDPQTGAPWPAMPEVFQQLATEAAAAAGYAKFTADACLINQYLPGTRMTLHQDRNELDFSAPIVSVSLGLSANFVFGGLRREDATRRTLLNHGDVVVWGGPARLRFHGVLPLKAGEHPLLGARRINLTFRKAG